MSAFTAEAHPRIADGTFTGKSQGEPELSLDATSDQVTLETTNGPVTITLGVLDEDAKGAFESGQCVSMATALARASGEDSVMLAVKSADDWGPPRIIHAFIDVGANLYFGREVVDAYGHRDAEAYYEELTDSYGEEGWDLVTIPVDDAEGIGSGPYGYGLPPQDYAAAAAFGPLVDRTPAADAG